MEREKARALGLIGFSFKIIFLLFSVSALAEPWQPGEKTSYSITYFGATAGILDLEVLPPSLHASKKVSELSAKVRTDSIFSLFYRFQNLYRSSVSPVTGLPLRFVTTHDETKFGGTVVQEFDHKKKKVTHLDRRLDRNSGQKLEKTLEREIPPDVHDVLSVFFHLRSLPLAVGKSFEVPVFIGEENHRLKVAVVEETTISTKIGDVPSYVLKPFILKDGQEKEVPETFVWIAKDKHRAMVKLKAKVKIGSVVGYLRSYEPGRVAK